MLSDDNIGEILSLWFAHQKSVENSYGHISNWDVGRLTTTAHMFEQRYDFNDDISKWDLSSVTDTSYMFHQAYSFDIPINNWDVSSVTTAWSMFEDAWSFNRQLFKWNTSGMKHMGGMFKKTRKFNRDISNWDITAADDVSSMFESSRAFDQNLTKWNISTCEIMVFMFYDATNFTQHLCWDVESKATFQMFAGSEDGTWDCPRSDAPTSSPTFSCGHVEEEELRDMCQFDVLQASNRQDLLALLTKDPAYASPRIWPQSPDDLQMDSFRILGARSLEVVYAVGSMQNTTLVVLDGACHAPFDGIVQDQTYTSEPTGLHLRESLSLDKELVRKSRMWTPTRTGGNLTICLVLTLDRPLFGTRAVSVETVLRLGAATDTGFILHAVETAPKLALEQSSQAVVINLVLACVCEAFECIEEERKGKIAPNTTFSICIYDMSMSKAVADVSKMTMKNGDYFKTLVQDGNPNGFTKLSKGERMVMASTRMNDEFFRYTNEEDLNVIIAGNVLLGSLGRMLQEGEEANFQILLELECVSCDSGVRRREGLDWCIWLPWLALLWVAAD